MKRSTQLALLLATTSLFSIFYFTPGFAEDVFIQNGHNQAEKLESVANIVITLQSIAINWIAPLMGTCLSIYGIYKIAVRETMIGTIALVSGGAMFFVKKILEGLRLMAG